MSGCHFCGEPTTDYLTLYLDRKKVDSVPVCPKHSLIAVVYEELGQGWLRDQLARLLNIRKGSVPRVKLRRKP